MNLGEWHVGDTLVFTCNTHDPSTGAATDADSAPAYRVYEQNTGTALLSGTMTKLDDANTTGFYVASIILAAGSGFEVGKNYVVYIQAAVGGVIGSGAHTFQVEYATWSNPARTLTMSPAQVAALVDGELSCPRGDTFTNTFTGLTLTNWTKVYFAVKRDLDCADSQSCVFVQESNPGVAADGLIYLNSAALVSPVVVGDASLTVDENAGTVVVRLEARATAQLKDLGPYRYELQIHTATSVTTPERGTFSVSLDVVRAIS